MQDVLAPSDSKFYILMGNVSKQFLQPFSIPLEKLL